MAICVYCGRDEARQFDHVIPRALGGGDEGSNLVPACAPCNGSKNATPLGEWLTGISIKAIDRALTAREVLIGRRLRSGELRAALPMSTDDFDAVMDVAMWERVQEQVDRLASMVISAHENTGVDWYERVATALTHPMAET